MAFGAILGQKVISGLLPQIIVTSNPNVQITASYNEMVVSAVSDSNGVAVLNVPGYGEWTVGAGAKTQNVVVDTVKQYSITQYIYDLLSSKSIGSIVQVKENNISTNYVVAVHDYYSQYNSNLTLLIRKELWQNGIGSSGSSNYLYTNLNETLSTTFLNLFSSTMQNMIASTTIQYANETSTSTPVTGQFKIFTPSATEWGFSESYMCVEGKRFNNTIINMFRPWSTDYVWTRSMYTYFTGSPGSMWALHNDSINAKAKNTTGWYLPCFAISGNTFVDGNNNIIEQ